jgi:hypothetical protein
MTVPAFLETLWCPDFGGVRFLDSRCRVGLISILELEQCARTQRRVTPLAIVKDLDVISHGGVTRGVVGGQTLTLIWCVLVSAGSFNASVGASWLVGVDGVRGFAGTLLREGLPGSAGIFVTLSDFTKPARSEARATGIALVDNRDLNDRIEKGTSCRTLPGLRGCLTAQLQATLVARHSSNGTSLGRHSSPTDAPRWGP